MRCGKNHCQKGRLFEIVWDRRCCIGNLITTNILLGFCNKRAGKTENLPGHDTLKICIINFLIPQS